MAGDKNGKVKVVIAFDRDHTKIGKTVEVDAATAQAWVAEGRAGYVDSTAARPKTAAAGTSAAPDTASGAPVVGADQAAAGSARKQP